MNVQMKQCRFLVDAHLLRVGWEEPLRCSIEREYLCCGNFRRKNSLISHRYKFDAILGGAEEVLGDLGVRQALKNMPKSML